MGREGCSLPHPQSLLQPQLSLLQPQLLLLHPQSLLQPQLLLSQRLLLHPQLEMLPHSQELLQHPQELLPRPYWLRHPLPPLQQHKSSKIQIQLFISSAPFSYRLCRRVILDKKKYNCYI